MNFAEALAAFSVGNYVAVSNGLPAPSAENILAFNAWRSHNFIGQLAAKDSVGRTMAFDLYPHNGASITYLCKESAGDTFTASDLTSFQQFVATPTAPSTTPTPTPTSTAGSTNPVVVASSALVAGMPVCLSRSTGQLIPARADLKTSAFVMGLAGADVAAGFPVSVKEGAITLSNWTAIAGAASLGVGLPYFLKSTGGLTSTPPGAPNCMALVGLAISTQSLMVAPEPPIQL